MLILEINQILKWCQITVGGRTDALPQIKKCKEIAEAEKELYYKTNF